MLKFWQQRTLAQLGAYRSFRTVDWSEVKRLVFVCTGNICRSPYAEKIASTLPVDLVSCGLSTRGGDPANEVAMRVANARGIDLTEHRSTRVDQLSLESSDLLICMEVDQARRAAGLRTSAQVAALGLLGAQLRPHIPDPFNRSEAYFARCFDWIDDDVASLARHFA